MRALRQFVYSLTLVLLPPLLAAEITAADISDYRAEVKAIRHGTIDLKASGDLVFELTESGLWSLQIDISGGPLKSHERSVGELIDNQFRPLNFERDTKFLLIKEKIRWNFDWTNQVVAGKVQKKEYEHPLTELIHDPISFQVSMRQAFLNGSSAYETPYLRYSRPDSLAFEVIGEELLSVGDDRVHTLIVKQTEPEKKEERKLIWVAPEYDFVPLRFATFKENKIKEEFFVEKLWIDDVRVDFSKAAQ
ncbi:DUF3108 domain-containing protein [Reinekea marinisedimentorum]|uniref:Uncharacterized protein DUF3108 n=1 Tax=Reinekea marinisedimentorum TaxID=230495 RepID=A0A4R3I8Q9_9GAMM|nr:DUF3108 domain-containing protein [Reinekea marinisedimentorum]TCS42653.1 uncharacterized protein DUF3108 [Reinekea marinisedimentorum]